MLIIIHVFFAIILTWVTLQYDYQNIRKQQLLRQQDLQNQYLTYWCANQRAALANLSDAATILITHAPQLREKIVRAKDKIESNLLRGEKVSNMPDCTSIPLCLQGSRCPPSKGIVGKIYRQENHYIPLFWPNWIAVIGDGDQDI